MYGFHTKSTYYVRQCRNDIVIKLSEQFLQFKKGTELDHEITTPMVGDDHWAVIT